MSDGKVSFMMFCMFRKSKYIVVFLFLILFIGRSQSVDHIIPVTHLVSGYEAAHSSSPDRDLTSFIINVAEPTCNSIAGVYVKDKLQLSVTQQPADQPGFVSTLSGTVTQFTFADEHGSVGLLAHNYLAGSDFYKIVVNDEIYLVNGNGQTERYYVTEIRQYQALEPTSPYSSFVDLSDVSHKIAYDELFAEIYGQADRLILQTCLSNQDSSSWGRHFVIAIPAKDALNRQEYMPGMKMAGNELLSGQK